MKKYLLIIFFSLGCFFASLAYASPSSQAEGVLMSEAEFRKLKKALEQGNVTELKKMLDEGLNVNSYYNCQSLLNFAIKGLAFSFGSVKNPLPPETVFSEVNILLQAGANVNGIKKPEGCPFIVPPTEQAITLHSTLKNLTNIWNEVILGEFYKIHANCQKNPNYDAACPYLTLKRINQVKQEINRQAALAQKKLEPYSLQMLQLLAQNGADLSYKDEKGNTLLHGVVINLNKDQNFDIIEYLLKQGIDINTQNNDGYTALFYTYDNPKLRDFLIQSGADTSIRSKSGLFYNEMTGQNIRKYFDGKELKKEVLIH